MDWVELQLKVPAADAERAADIANMVVPYGLYIEDYSDLEEGAREIAHIDLIDEELLQKNRAEAILHLYIDPDENPAEAVAFLTERFAAARITCTVVQNTVSETDWANNWKKYFKPLPVGEKLLICPTWEEAGEQNDRAVLSIDPGLAFGTGGHDTTRLVLETLEQYVTEQTTLLDVGCGSGILSIAALLLGAAKADGIDIDPLAVKTALENGALNGFVPPKFTAREGDLATDVTEQYDIVVANIVADAIIALSPAVVPLLKTGGVYIVSGIIDTREQDVLPALAAAGFTVTARRAHGGWVCLTCQRR
ncbi:MAG: 50S ribosomal protein L11 methyltransferase [Ruminococcaceae bacterium]|nr:50S ribosomal protein L11 methyltransferase [Oscillospiraceae bacterium]